MGWYRPAASPRHPGAPMTATEAELFGVLGELRRPLSRWPWILRPSQLSLADVVLFPHPDPEWRWSYAPLFGCSRNRSGIPALWDWRRRLPMVCRAWRATLLPAGPWRRDYFGAPVPPLQPSGIVPAGPDLATWCPWISRGAPAMNRTHQRAAGGPERPGHRPPADPVFEGVLRLLHHHRHRPTRKVAGFASPCSWLSPLARPPCLWLWATAAPCSGPGCFVMALGLGPGAALDSHLCASPCIAPLQLFWLLAAWAGWP